MNQATRRRTLSCCLLMLAIGPAVQGPRRPRHSEKYALARMENAFRPTLETKDAFAARRKAIRGLEGHDTPGAVRALVRAYATLDTEAEPIAKERARVLVEGTSLELARFRKKLDPIHVLMDEVLRALAPMDGPEVADEMLLQLVSGRTLPLSLALSMAGRLGRLRAASELGRALEREPGPGDAIALLRVIRSLGRRGSFFGSWAVTRLQDESPTVRLEAAGTLAAIGYEEALSRLIDRLAHEEGRALDVFVAALRKLSGKGFGASPDAWRRWLKKKNEGTARAGGETFSGPRRKLGSYFGIPLKGQAIVYVYDRSDSMERGMRSGGRRIDKSRRELSRALGELRESVRFNIVAFSIKVSPWSPELRKATPENIKEARAWLRSLDPSAGTSSYDALERAFQLAGHRTSDRFWELEVETIFFLSDGEPTRRTGGFRTPLVRDDPARILSAVRRWNALDRVVVHTIGLGLQRASAPRFMRELAEQNGGRFVAFR